MLKNYVVNIFALWKEVIDKILSFAGDPVPPGVDPEDMMKNFLETFTGE